MADTPSGTGDPAALLDQIRGSTQEASYTLYGEGMAVIPRRHLDGLLKVAEAALKLADDWDAEGASQDRQAKRLADNGSMIVSAALNGRAETHQGCAAAFREAIRTALAEEGTA